MSAETKTTETTASLDSLKQIDAGLLNVRYAEDGPATGHSVVLLHGWPHGIHSYVEVTPQLSSAGNRIDRAVPARLWNYSPSYE